MEFTVTESMGPRFLEGVPKQSCMRNADDAATVLQECLSRRVDRMMEIQRASGCLVIDERKIHHHLRG
jgi:hypothetical protein